MNKRMRFSRSEITDLVERAFVASNVSSHNATVVADALIRAEIDGQKGHGLTRVASYCAQARSGKVNGHAIPSLTQERAGYFRVDAAHGFAFPAIRLAMEALEKAAKEQAIAAVGITRSHHCGQLGAHVEALAERGLLSIMVANTPKAMAPWGGKRAVFGTNPIAFATPRANALPLVIDLSLSKVARGKIVAAQKAGEPIPEGWILNPDGNPTTDPAMAFTGTLTPAGDAKGAALALLVEILSATLIGANQSYDAGSFFEAEGVPPGVGQFIIAMDASLIGGSGFPERLEALFQRILAEEGTRLPGQGRRQRRKAAKDGILILEDTYQEIIEIAESSRNSTP